MSDKKILGYINEDSIVTEEQVKILTHIHVAFGRLTMEGTISFKNHPFLKQLPQIRKWNPEIKVILSVIGEEPGAFTVCSASESLREKVSESCRNLVEEEGFDGVDFDWEYPCVSTNGSECSHEDKQNFTLLCQAAKKACRLPGAAFRLQLRQNCFIWNLQNQKSWQKSWITFV